MHNILVRHYRGDIALITRTTFSDASAPWTLEQTWTNAHVGVVRSALWDEEVRSNIRCLESVLNEDQNNILITGGEDSRINVWSAPSVVSGSESPSARRESDNGMDVDEDPTHSHRKRRRAD